ncbi:MAG: peptide-methionine (S)-S-oxide reductase MsrA, partial [Firmicutes bacterium]|nr:peptide-methionine (S)-S-oxide reductase MsrA [Bacillota bacterium]
MKNVLYLAGGCFWGVQKYLDSINGIISSFVGYANGDSNATTYKQVCNGSGHVEVVKIVYNDVITIEQLLDKFLKIIDPFSNNKQGNDVGVQYRTGIYYV